MISRLDILLLYTIYTLCQAVAGDEPGGVLPSFRWGAGTAFSGRPVPDQFMRDLHRWTAISLHGFHSEFNCLSEW